VIETSDEPEVMCAVDDFVQWDKSCVDLVTLRIILKSEIGESESLTVLQCVVMRYPKIIFPNFIRFRT
jgi:hypothetical protein